MIVVEPMLDKIPADELHYVPQDSKLNLIILANPDQTVAEVSDQIRVKKGFLFNSKSSLFLYCSNNVLNISNTPKFIKD